MKRRGSMRRKRCLALLLTGLLVLSNVATTIYADEPDEFHGDHIHTDEADEFRGDHIHTADGSVVFIAAEDVLAVTPSNAVRPIAAETEGPVITVTPAVEGHNRGDFYCEPPEVTVTDEQFDIVSVTVTTSEGQTVTKPEAEQLREVVIDLTGKTNKITITAKNKADRQSEVTFYISHYIGSREEYTVPATCTDPARKALVQFCAMCGEAYYRSYTPVAGSEPLGHDFGDSVSPKICARCGYIDNASIIEHEHVYEDFVLRDATCTEEGIKYKKCTLDGCEKIEGTTSIPIKGHLFGAWKEMQKADCKTGTQRIDERECSRCSQSETRKYDATHTWSVDAKIYKEATCSAEGELRRQCTECGTWSPSYTKIAKLSHTWEDDGDCTTPKVCSVCRETDVTSQSSHHLAYKSDANGHWQECLNEGCEYSTKSETGGYVPHEFNKNSVKDCTNASTCVVCSWSRPGAGSHNLTWEINASGHVAICQNEGCEYRSQQEAHAGTFSNDCSVPTTCKKCGYAYIAAKAHVPYGIVHWNNDGHYWNCRNCDQIVTEAHSLGRDDGDCTTPITCAFSSCGYVMMPGNASHDFTGAWLSNSDGHYTQCQNPNCSKTSAPIAHTGGLATCISLAVCDICGNSYGSTDSGFHVGGTEMRDYKEPTKTSTGYTGDTYCLSCGAMIISGQTIDKVQCEEHIFEGSWSYDGVGHWKYCKECEVTRGEYAPHDFTAWNQSEGIHSRSCTECGYTEAMVHTPEADDGNCETPIVCSVCEMVLTETMSHDFAGSAYLSGTDGHYRLCQNQGCEAKSAEEAHKGGNASCSGPAVCELCYGQYGGLDPDNHLGLEEVRNHKDATATEPGYTGDVYCLGCGKVKVYGQEIPAEAKPPVHGNGYIDKKVQAGAGAPAVSVPMDTQKLADAVLTEAEKQAAVAGAQINIILSVKNANNTVSAADRSAVEAKSKSGSYKVGQYLDLRLIKEIDGMENAVTKTVKPITITVSVPDSLKGNSKRTFSVIRVHEGTATILNDQDSAPDTITFKTDHFSTYAIVYHDTSDSSGGGSGSGSGGSSGGGGGSGASGGSGSGGKSSHSSSSGINPGTWILSDKGWWFRNEDGTWPYSQWRQLYWNGTLYWYYFDAEGYMQTGWLDWNGARYYLHPVSDGNQGYMYTSWHIINGIWYYFDGSGALLVNGKTPDGYYVDENGAWIQ